jgi:hypothetical protein
MSTDGYRERREIDLRLPDGFLLFIIKVCVVVGIISAAAVITSSIIIARVEESTARTIASLKPDKIGGRQFWSGLEKQLDRAADPSSDLPPEEKEKLISDLRAISTRWRPFLEAIQGDQKPSQEKTP